MDDIDSDSNNNNYSNKNNINSSNNNNNNNNNNSYDNGYTSLLKIVQHFQVPEKPVGGEGRGGHVTPM